jgi:hypothetical protein
MLIYYRAAAVKLFADMGSMGGPLKAKTVLNWAGAIIDKPDSKCLSNSNVDLFTLLF